ncbi:hypothetical protein [Brevundimonas sp.]|uniref:hypothetical protein n=1 Tax=Brevundimonas sp. TaxID=1871086 RepID=UPI002D540D83|nr:hypothetical protein [Brevundimonas sp.]HYD26953.1 hypothetical protein [Brevundimonas sp.]
MLNAWLTLLCGALCLFASACVGTHEILMSPDRPNYPTAQRRLRMLMFLWSGTLLYRGVELTTAAWAGLAWGAPVLPVTPGQVSTCIMLAAVHAALLEQHLRMWLPSRLQERVRHWLHIASCGRTRMLAEARAQSNRGLRPGVEPLTAPPAVVSGALAELAMSGAVVAGPGDGPEVLLHAAPPVARP